MHSQQLRHAHPNRYGVRSNLRRGQGQARVHRQAGRVDAVPYRPGFACSVLVAGVMLAAVLLPKIRKGREEAFQE